MGLDWMDGSLCGATIGASLRDANRSDANNDFKMHQQRKKEHILGWEDFTQFL